MRSDTPYFLIWQLALSTPALLTFLLAFALAITYRKRAPTAAILTIAAACLMIAAVLLTLAMQVALTFNQNLDFAQRGMFIGVLSMTGTVLRTVGLICLVAAVFADRSPANSLSPSKGDPF